MSGVEVGWKDSISREKKPAKNETEKNKERISDTKKIFSHAKISDERKLATTGMFKLQNILKIYLLFLCALAT